MVAGAVEFSGRMVFAAVAIGSCMFEDAGDCYETAVIPQRSLFQAQCSSGAKV